MRHPTYLTLFLTLSSLLGACGGGDEGADAGHHDAASGEDAAQASDAAADLDGGASDDAGPDRDAAPHDGGPSCLEQHAALDRYPAGDHCNFCECGDDGVETCTTRTCAPAFTSCELDGRGYAYGETFELGDGCNECVCAASGLACTRRTCDGAREEGAILLENMTSNCGERLAFTPANMLAEMPFDTVDAPFLYERDRVSYPETRADTTVSFRVAYANGFAVCRIEAPGRAALDLEAIIEWRTADGAFDEGLHAYLRKNDFGFVDAWFIATSLPLGSIEGSYTPACLDPRALAFSAQIDRTGAASGSVMKTCETDIGLQVGHFEITP